MAVRQDRRRVTRSLPSPEYPCPRASPGTCEANRSIGSIHNKPSIRPNAALTKICKRLAAHHHFRDLAVSVLRIFLFKDIHKSVWFCVFGYVSIIGDLLNVFSDESGSVPSPSYWPTGFRQESSGLLGPHFRTGPHHFARRCRRSVGWQGLRCGDARQPLNLEQSGCNQTSEGVFFAKTGDRHRYMSAISEALPDAAQAAFEWSSWTPNMSSMATLNFGLTPVLSPNHYRGS